MRVPASTRSTRATPRLRALIRDLAVQFVILLCVVVPPTVMANQDLLQVLAPVSLLAFVFYEPVLIAVRGATLGHSPAPRESREPRASSRL